MPVTASVKARVNLVTLKNLDTKIDKGDTLIASGAAVEALSYLREHGFRVKIDTTRVTREYEIIVFSNGNSGSKKVVTATGYYLWSAVRSVLFHFLK